MLERNDWDRNVEGKAGWRCHFLSAVVGAAAAICTMFAAPASAQTGPAPKNGLYLYVCLPGNIQGDLTKGGSGLVVFNVDQGLQVRRTDLFAGGPWWRGAGQLQGHRREHSDWVHLPDDHGPPSRG
jgi:hypothetical protein